MMKHEQTRDQLFEEFKRMLEGDSCQGDTKLALVLQYLDAIIKAPTRVIH